MLLTSGTPAALRCGLSLKFCALLDDIGLDHAQLDNALQPVSLDESSHVIRNPASAVPLAVLCHHGDRGVHAAEHLHRLGHRDVYYIEGGIEAWANPVHPSVPHY